MDLVTWLIFAAIALFFDVAVGWWKRQRQKNAEPERGVAKREYSVYQPEDSRYFEGTDSLESATPLDIQTYDEETRRPTGRRVSAQEVEGYEVIPPGEQEPRKVIVHVPVEGKPVSLEKRVRGSAARDAQVRQTILRETTTSDMTPRKPVNAVRTQLRPAGPAGPSIPRRSASHTLTFNPQTARDAIVWMEVLGTPKGMQS